DIGLSQRAMTAQPVEYIAEAITEAVEHPVLDAHLRQQKRQCAKLADWRPRLLPRVCRSLPRKRSRNVIAMRLSVNCAIPNPPPDKMGSHQVTKHRGLGDRFSRTARVRHRSY